MQQTTIATRTTKFTVDSAFSHIFCSHPNKNHEVHVPFSTLTLLKIEQHNRTFKSGKIRKNSKRTKNKRRNDKVWCL